MKTESTQKLTLKPLLNTVTQGNCVNLLKQMPTVSVDLLLTDPPYVARYATSDGRTVPNDHFASLSPAMAEAYRVLRPNRFAAVFYGWSSIDKYADAFRHAGFRIVGHLVFRKRYTSASRYLSYRHESAYLLAKGYPVIAGDPIADVRDWDYTGNKLHPTQKPLSALLPLVEAFSQRGEIVLDRSAAPALHWPQLGNSAGSSSVSTSHMNMRPLLPAAFALIREVERSSMQIKISAIFDHFCSRNLLPVYCQINPQFVRFVALLSARLHCKNRCQIRFPVSLKRSKNCIVNFVSIYQSS